MPTWIDTLADDLVQGINKFIQKVTAPGSTKPLPGTLTNYLKDTITKHAPKSAAVPPVPPISVPAPAIPAKAPETNEALTIDQIYATPPAGLKTPTLTVLEFVRSKKSCRVSDVVKETGVDKDSVVKIVESNGYKIAKAGWLQAA